MLQNTHHSAGSAAGPHGGYSTMVSYNLARLMGYLQGPGANVVATLQQHCYAAMPGIAANKCSPARNLYRANGHGANATGHSRYPKQAGKVYAAQLGAAQQATAQGVTTKQQATLQRKVGSVWAKRQAAAKAGAKAAKGQAKAQAAPAQAEVTAQP